jgi:hypothetical protein
LQQRIGILQEQRDCALVVPHGSTEMQRCPAQGTSASVDIGTKSLVAGIDQQCHDVVLAESGADLEASSSLFETSASGIQHSPVAFRRSMRLRKAHSRVSTSEVRIGSLFQQDLNEDVRSHETGLVERCPIVLIQGIDASSFGNHGSNACWIAAHHCMENRASTSIVGNLDTCTMAQQHLGNTNTTCR